LVLSLSPAAIFAQIDIFNNSLTEPEVNVLYRGVENEMRITGVECDSTLMLTSTTGEVRPSRRADHCSFTIYPNFCLKNDTLRVFRGDTLLFFKIYEYRSVGRPDVRYGTHQDTLLTVEEVLSDPSFYVVIPGCYYRHNSRVRSFRVSLFHANGDTIELFDQTNGRQLTNQQINAISALNPGDVIWFTDLTSRCPVSSLLKHYPLKITVK